MSKERAARLAALKAALIEPMPPAARGESAEDKAARESAHALENAGKAALIDLVGDGLANMAKIADALDRLASKPIIAVAGAGGVAGLRDLKKWPQPNKRGRAGLRPSGALQWAAAFSEGANRPGVPSWPPYPQPELCTKSTVRFRSLAPRCDPG